jgi:hypothetical protein
MNLPVKPHLLANATGFQCTNDLEFFGKNLGILLPTTQVISQIVIRFLMTSGPLSFYLNKYA